MKGMNFIASLTFLLSLPIPLALVVGKGTQAMTMGSASFSVVSVAVSPSRAAPCSRSSRPVWWSTPAATSQAKAKAMVMTKANKKHALGFTCRCASPPPPPLSHLEAEAEAKEQLREPITSPGVRVALSLLLFYKTQISPFLPRSCRFVPTCSDYSMQAYTKYGFLKGSVLTVYRICRCNPFGGYGFDPPRWFGEEIEEPPSHSDI